MIGKWTSNINEAGWCRGENYWDFLIGGKLKDTLTGSGLGRWRFPVLRPAETGALPAARNRHKRRTHLAIQLTQRIAAQAVSDPLRPVHCGQNYLSPAIFFVIRHKQILPAESAIMKLTGRFIAGHKDELSPSLFCGRTGD